MAVWTTPQLTELDLIMTAGGNKVGTSTDMYTGETSLIGTVTPVPGHS